MNKLFFKIIVGLTVCVAVIFFFGAFSKPTELKHETKTDQIIGVWKCVQPTSWTEGGREHIKIITKGRFIWTNTSSTDKMILVSAGGTYSFDGETYTESVDFGMPSMKSFIGVKAVCKIRFEGNKMYQTGTLSGAASPINEIWERVE